MEDKKPKLKYKVKGKTGLTLKAFPYTITEDLLNGPDGSNHIHHIANYEKANGVKILGTLITKE